jgi:hypothetical protein
MFSSGFVARYCLLNPQIIVVKCEKSLNLPALGKKVFCIGFNQAASLIPVMFHLTILLFPFHKSSA